MHKVLFIMKKNWSELGTFGLVFGRDFNLGDLDCNNCEE
jgi:hypothetical protein